jgi:hypothetical protein
MHIGVKAETALPLKFQNLMQTSLKKNHEEAHYAAN